jgi:hypothetical protein
MQSLGWSLEQRPGWVVGQYDGADVDEALVEAHGNSVLPCCLIERLANQTRVLAGDGHVGGV